MPPVTMRISFAAPMVAALISGDKIETRRHASGIDRYGKRARSMWLDVEPGTVMQVREPIYREAERIDGLTAARLMERVCYRADGDGIAAPAYRFNHVVPAGWEPAPIGREALSLPSGRIEWGSPRMMPVWAGRLNVTLRETRVERLLDITDQDAMAEGAIQRETGWSMDWSGVGRKSSRLGRVVTEEDIAKRSPRGAFLSYWDYLNSRQEGVDPNPELVVLSLSVARLPHPCWSARA